MNLILQFFGSSIGKKMLMALTGLCFCIFLIIHLIGNLTIYGGAKLFNLYAKHLHELGPIITITEYILLFLFMMHVSLGITIFIQNRLARPVKYLVKKNGGGRSIGSITMLYTGLVIFFFIIFHLCNFKFIDKTNETIFQIIYTAFKDPKYVVFYITAIIFMAIHISHGFWSAFQTVGANHPKYMSLIKMTSFILSLLIAIGFGFLPVFLNLKLSRTERVAYERYIEDKRVAESSIRTSWFEGNSIGVEKGREEGREKGREKGRKEGREEGELIGEIRLFHKILSEPVPLKKELSGKPVEILRKMLKEVEKRWMQIK